MARVRRNVVARDPSTGGIVTFRSGDDAPEWLVKATTNPEVIDQGSAADKATPKRTDSKRAPAKRGKKTGEADIKGSPSEEAKAEAEEGSWDATQTSSESESQPTG